MAFGLEWPFHLAQPIIDLEGIGNVADTRFGSEEAELNVRLRRATPMADGQRGKGEKQEKNVTLERAYGNGASGRL